MDQHPDSEEIYAFSERRLPVEETLRMDVHMEVCARCRDQWASLLRKDAFADLMPAEKPRHLSYQQIKAIVGNSPPPDAGPELPAHLRTCQGCRAEIEELRAFAAMLAGPEEAAELVGQSKARRARFAAPQWKWVAAAAVLLLAVGVVRFAPAAGTISAQLASVEKISDDGDGYMLDSRGDVLGWPALPQRYRSAILAAADGQQPSGSLDIRDAQQRFGQSHLIMGVAYWEAGMSAQAKAEFEQLKSANPQAPVIDRLVDACKTR